MKTSLEMNVLPAQLPQGSAHSLAVSESDRLARELESVRTTMAEQLNALKAGPAKSAGIYQIRSGGSMLRARLALASGRAFACSRGYRIVSAAACEFIHNASLVHDDLLDKDEERRALPTVWKKFGNGVALCTGDLLVCAAFSVSSRLENPEEFRILNGLLAQLTSQVIVGQSQEIGAESDQSTPGFRDYLDATIGKTAPLIEMPLLAGAIAGGAKEQTKLQISDLARAIGLAYQIIDDFDDLSTDASYFHPFHAWHFHHQGPDTPLLQRVRRAVKHATAALNRARTLLVGLDQDADQPLSPFVLPLLDKLEKRAMAHCRLAETHGVVSNENIAV